MPSTSGDLLILVTREDLIANALTLLAAASPTNSIQQEPWFHDASAALPTEKTAPALHMMLNLDRIVPDPHFRSYWVQHNITWTKQFRAAASDLYLESDRFREERTLLPKSPETEHLHRAPDRASRRTDSRPEPSPDCPAHVAGVVPGPEVVEP